MRSIRPGLFKTSALALAVTLALAGCAVGPDYVRPETQVPEHFAQAAADANPTPSAADAEFWTRFGDARLAALIEQALAANNDLKVALAHYERANAQLRGAKFDALPVITAGANAQDIRSSADQLPGVSREDRDTRSYDASVGAAWELDLFGRIRRSIEAGRADAAASAADLAAAQVAIAGSVARTYIDLRGLQERLRVARDNADNQRETLRLVDARVDAGGGTDFDSARARAQLETTDARIPALEAQIAFAMHRIAVLTGRTPDALIADLQAPAELPALPDRLDAATPGELLRRRPDVAAAEQRLHAATARIGVATADLFPRFTLGGLIGTQAAGTGALFERDSETHLLALGVDWSFLDVGHVRARIAESGADADAALAQYRQAVLLALEDTENALVRYAKARAEDAQLERAAADSAAAARLARVRYEAGAIGLLDVLDAERSRLQAQDAFADARTRSITGAVSLYQALAGGWPQRVPERERVAQR
ncbi:efflux transporter outer membrane subunit [Dokdonella sp.]|uniref:efflux transporter outer membrane subunit n=1 Tax=Dokdonella sp. TaxID=2291710 RepID=UPI0037852BDE